MSENRSMNRFKYGEIEERAPKRRRREEAEIEFPVENLQHVQQPGPCSQPDSDVRFSSNCEGSSSSRSNKFDVFISHRGPDTKYTLAYHMYDVLRLKGIKAFLDKEELQSGEGISKVIEEVIGYSKVDVCIFSTGYAESVWCLKELEMMLDKYEMDRSKLIPVFYDVRPSDVRYLQGSFGQAFQKLKDKGRHSSQVIDKWRNALYKVAEIKGYEGKGELCMTIVNMICEQLFDVGKVATSARVVGRQQQLSSIIHDIRKCREEGLGVTSVEISGIRGIGKTTFAKELYNQICPQYERCYFIEDVWGHVDKHGVNEVHKQLIGKLFKYDATYCRMEEKKLLKDRLHNEEILVVIDNIDSKIPLRSVFVEDDVYLRPTSIIIVTSREERVLRNDPRVAHYCKNFISLQLSKLDFHASKQIFLEYAFRGIYNVNSEFEELIDKIVEKCDGTPLALTLLGTQVYGKDIKFCRNLWNSVKDSLHPDMKKILKFSYDNLDTKLEKCLFLDVAIFLRWEKVELLVQLRHRNDEDGESEILYALDMLKMKLLIEVTMGGFLNMHDLLVDLGRSIVKDEDSCPGHRSRVWHPSDVRDMLSEEMGTKRVKALSLVSKVSTVLDEDGCPWPANAFSKMSSLEFLIIHGHCIEGDLSSLSKRLLWLRWTDFPYDCIPLTLCLKRVRVLELSGERLNLLWKYPPKEAPINIRQLSLSNSKNLTRLPEFTQRFRHLSCIQLTECTSLETIPDSFGELQLLKDLKLIRCKTLVQLPETFGNLKSLSNLKIRDCHRIKSLPESFGELLQLESLEVWRCPVLKHLPESFGNLSQLYLLYFGKCRLLKHLPESFGNLSQLNLLYLGKCQLLEPLPESFGRLRQLRWLVIFDCNCEGIEDCSGIKKLSKSCGCLPNLFNEQFQLLHHNHELHIRRFQDGTETAYCSCGQIPGSEQQNIDCWQKNSQKISRCHVEAPQQQQLTSLAQIMKQTRDTADLFSGNKQHAHPELSDLELIATRFIQPPESASRPLHQMRSLSLKGFCHIPELPQSLGDFQHMESLMLDHCHSLQKLPDSIGNLSRLRYLRLGMCLNLKLLPPRIGNLSQLHHLSLISCCNLRELPDTIGNLQNLQQLIIHDCIVLKGFPSSLGNLSGLKKLCVTGCWMVEVMHTDALFSLKELEVIGCVNLRSIAGFSGLCQVERLTIEGCLNLTHILGVVGSALKSLQTLNISGCYHLRFPDDDGLVEQLPNELDMLQLSLNHNFLSASLHKTLPATLEWLAYTKAHSRVLNAKTSPLLFTVVEQRIRDLVSTKDESFFSFHQLSRTHNPSLQSFLNTKYAAVVCFVSTVYAGDLPMHLPPPLTQFTSTNFNQVGRFDFGEEIHLSILRNTVPFETLNCKVCKATSYYPRQYPSYYPSYEAAVEKGWVIFEDGGEGKNELLTAEICNIFYSELMKQRLLSRAWTHLPSQLQIFEFSALDIAGCHITKKSRHCNTCIMEEETGLTWKRRWCPFTDDHALLLQHPRNSSKQSFLAYPGFDPELQGVANLYEMSIYVLVKGKVVQSRKLQEITSINEKEIPPVLNTLLQTKASHSTSEAMDRKILRTLHSVRNRGLTFER